MAHPTTEGSLLAILDTETTGLSLLDDKLLSVGVLVVDAKTLEVLDENGFESKIGFERWQVEEMRVDAHPVVREMHDTSGLWNQLVGAPTAFDMALELNAYLDSFPRTGQLHLTGNSIYFDRDFLRTQLPMVFPKFSRHLVDISSMAVLVENWFGYKHPKVKRHEVISDCWESLDELRYYRKNFFTGPNVPLTPMG